jgi:hypothetical protein
MKRTVKFWQAELQQAGKHEKRFRDRARKVIDIYRDDKRTEATHFNILWSNTQTQRPALYSSTPKPVVKRRHGQKGKDQQIASVLLERSLTYMQDPGGAYDFDRVGEKCVLDYLLPGRMIARCKYHPTTVSKERDATSELQPEGEFTTDDSGKFLFKEKYDELVDEEVRVHHIPFDQYRQAVADHWDDVWWIAYGNNFLTRDEIIDQFGNEHADVPLTHLSIQSDKDGWPEEGATREVKKAQVWEIWDRDERMVYAIVEGYDKFLMKEEDPLRLRGFYPGPEPVLIVETPNSIIPIPEYCMYEPQAQELNIITRRIELLVKAMKLSGVYPGSQKKHIEEMLNSEENTLVPIEDWQAITERGGLGGMIEWVPLKEVADSWQRLMVYRQQLIQDIFELTGISDIQRGATDPRETKGAQVLKAGFGTRRLLPKQQDTQRFFRDIFRIQAEIVAEHFQTETIARMAQLPLTEEVVKAREMIKDDALRSFAIDIETDSTIAADEMQDKQGVAEFMSAMGMWMQQAFPIIQAQPAAMGPLGQMLLWMTRKFRLARDAEDELEGFLETFQQLPDQQKAAQQQAQAAEQAKLQMEQAKLQQKAQESAANQQIKAQESQAEIARKERESIAQMEREERKLGMELAKMQLDIEYMAAKIGLSREEAEAKVLMNAAALQQKSLQQGSESVKSSESASVNVVEPPKAKRIKLIKDKEGKISGADVMPITEEKRTVTFKRDSSDKIAGAEIEEA